MENQNQDQGSEARQQEQPQVQQALTKEQQHVYTILDTLGINYKTLDHPVITTMEEGREIMKQLEGSVCVNILLQDKAGAFYLVAKSLTTQMKVNQLGKALGIIGLTMAPKEAMGTVLKVPPGCATVFAVYENPNVTVLIDNQLPKDKPVNFHPMRNDATTTISYSDMVKYVEHCGNRIIYF